VLHTTIRLRAATVIAAVIAIGAGQARSPDLTGTPRAILVGGRIVYDVKAGDTMASIGARFGVAQPSLIELNQLTQPARLAAGQSLVIDNTHLAVVDPRVSLTINIAQRLLVFVEPERVTAYPITVGLRTWPTPVGAFTIVEKETNPAWDVPISIQREMEAQGKPVITRMAPSPLNPLGAHFLRLSLPGIGIHGTNAPSSIYRFASHGCIRMHPDDVAELFGRVGLGTAGVLLYQPVIVGLAGGRVWLEANRDEYRRAPNALHYVRDAVQRGGLSELIDWKAVDDVLRLRLGRAVDVTKLPTTEMARLQ
jgi:L,D-transpeptidase ErfK/SrfK